GPRAVHDRDGDAGARVHARGHLEEAGGGLAARGPSGADGEGRIGGGGEKGEETCGESRQRHRSWIIRPDGQASLLRPDSLRPRARRRVPAAIAPKRMPPTTVR